MCNPVCGKVHIKKTLLLIGKSSPNGGSGFPLSLSECFFTICPTPYNRKQNVLNESLNKTFPSSRKHSKYEDTQRFEIHDLRRIHYLSSSTCK